MLLLAQGYTSIIHLAITLHFQVPCLTKESTHVPIQSACDHMSHYEYIYSYDQMISRIHKQIDNGQNLGNVNEVPVEHLTW